jgi:hypothetical protein
VEKELGLSEASTDGWWPDSNSVISKTYALPSRSVEQTMLARNLSELVLQKEDAWLEITYWHDDIEANQDLFYGYRKGCGDTRSLADASVHRFSSREKPELFSILSMVVFFSWDARLLDKERTYLIAVSHDGFLDIDTSSESFLHDAESALELAGVKPRE